LINGSAARKVHHGQSSRRKARRPGDLPSGVNSPMKVAFAGAFASQLVEPVRARLTVPCEIVAGDEATIMQRLADVDVLVSMEFSMCMAAAAPRLRLVQVPGAGLDPIDRGALRPGIRLANVFGHEAGIAEYIMGAMIALEPPP
jgi:phosphoglycerate dehydrogenase-like enzyme